MKLTKKTFIMMLLSIIILPLLGNENLNNFLHINIIVTLLNYLIPGLLCVFLLFDMYKQKKWPKFEINSVATVLFWVVIILSFIFAISHKIFNCSNLFKFGCMTFILYSLKDIEFEDKQKKGILYTILAASAFISLLGIGQYIFQINLNTSGIEKYIGALGRINSTTYIATILDKYMALNIFLVLVFIYKKWTNKYINYIVLVLNILALSFTFSRTGLLIYLFLVVLFLIIFLFRKRFINALLILLLTVGMYMIPGQNFVYSSLARYLIDVGYSVSEKIELDFIGDTAKFILNPFVIDVYEYMGDESIDEDVDEQLTSNIDYSLSSRSYYKKIATSLMKEHWELGIGIGSYTHIFNNQNVNDYLVGNPYEEYFRYPHNMYLQLGAEIGIVGMIIFFFNIIFMLLKRTFKSKSVFPIILCICVLLVCYTESIFYMKDIAYFTILLIALFSNKYFLTDNDKVIEEVVVENKDNEKKKSTKKKVSTEKKVNTKKKANSKK